MGAAGDGWRLRGRSRSATGFPLLQVCVGWEDASSGVWGGGSALGCPLWGAEEAWSWEGEEGRGGGPYGAAAVGVSTSAPVVISQPTPLGAVPLRFSCAAARGSPRCGSGGGEMLPSQPRDGGGLQPTLHPFPTAAPPVPPLHPLSSPPSPRGSTHRIPTAPRAFVARWGPRAATPPPPSSPRSPRSAEAGMHAGTCVAWLSATGPPPLPSGAATANAGSVRDPLPGAAGTGAAPPPPLAAHLQLQCRGAAEQQRAPPPPHRSGDGQRGMGWVAVGTACGGERGRELLGHPEGPLPAEGVSALPHIAPPPPRPRWARPDGPALIS